MPVKGMLIINPNAAAGKSGKRATPLLARLPPDWRATVTHSFSEGVQTAQQLCEAGVPLSVAVGGDGTLCSVVNGYMGAYEARKAPLDGIALSGLPFGTGNDAVRELGIPDNPFEAFAQLQHGASHPVDVGCLQRAEQPPLYFFNVAGIGFDARVNAATNPWLKRRVGALAYVIAVLKTLTWFKPFRMKIHLDGEPVEEKVMLVALANGRSYGGGMRVAPQARFDDGQLDVCIVGSIGKVEFLRTFPKVFRGTHVEHPAIRIVRAREVEVVTEPPEPLTVDGDVLAFTPIRCRLLPGAVRFALPPQASL